MRYVTCSCLVAVCEVLTPLKDLQSTIDRLTSSGITLVADEESVPTIPGLVDGGNGKLGIDADGEVDSATDFVFQVRYVVSPFAPIL